MRGVVGVDEVRLRDPAVVVVTGDASTVERPPSIYTAGEEEVDEAGHEKERALRQWGDCRLTNENQLPLLLARRAVYLHLRWRERVPYAWCT